ncbi:MAG: winged helix-turn-helix transcriptional regulator [Bacteroides sp.]|nr:winged helix-turn-helix transcriptional regulator [Bacteroides sp.]
MKTELERLIDRYNELGINRQLDYDKFYLYSIITHSTAIEGSTITELENLIMFDNGIALKGKSIIEQNMNLDLKAAYERALEYARNHDAVTIERLKTLSALTMKNTGTEYHTALGDFSSANGDIRLVNVSAGIGGRSYMAFNKVHAKLKEFCIALNDSRRNADKMTIQQLYEMSFDAHYNLVTIHPWADGNGRMARLLMNWLQFEYGLIPSRIFSDDKEEYIKALVATREEGDLSVFRRFMTETMIAHLQRDIKAYEEFMDIDIAHEESGSYATGQRPGKTRDKVLELLRHNPKLTANAIADRIGISTKGIQRHLANLKAEGLLLRVGPDKGGEWRIVE